MAHHGTAIPQRAQWASDLVCGHDAIPVVGGRYHAIVVDEGQDFARGWLDSLYLMLTDREHDVLYVFHDPAQSLYRDDWCI